MVRSSRGSTEYKAVAPISAYNGGFASDFVIAWLLQLNQLASRQGLWRAGCCADNDPTSFIEGAGLSVVRRGARSARLS
jgi:hypothetical protein